MVFCSSKKIGSFSSLCVSSPTFMINKRLKLSAFNFSCIFSGLFPRGRFSAVGGTYRRSIFDRQQLTQFCLVELLLLLLNEFVLFLMYMFNVYSRVLNVGMHILVDLYIVWQSWDSYLVCRTKYPVLFSENNVDIHPILVVKFSFSLVINMFHKLISVTAAVNPQQIPSSQDLELNAV